MPFAPMAPLAPPAQPTQSPIANPAAPPVPAPMVPSSLSPLGPSNAPLDAPSNLDLLAGEITEDAYAPLAPDAVTTQGECCGGSGGGDQTPWKSDIDGAGYSLSGVNELDVNGNVSIAGDMNSSSNNFHISAAAITLSGSSIIQIQGNGFGPGYTQFYNNSFSIIGGGFTVKSSDNSVTFFEVSTSPVSPSPIIMNNLPTSSVGLISGCVWNNNGVLNIVP